MLVKSSELVVNALNIQIFLMQNLIFLSFKNDDDMYSVASLLGTPQSNTTVTT